MSQRKQRHFRRVLAKRLEPHLEKLAGDIFEDRVFKPRPRWMPRFLWRIIVKLVIK